MTPSRPVHVDGRQVGAFYPDRRLFVTKRRNGAILRRPPAICLDAGVVRELDGAGCETVEVRLTDQGRIIHAPFERFVSRGFAVSRGFGPQVGLELRHFEEVRSKTFLESGSFRNSTQHTLSLQL